MPATVQLNTRIDPGLKARGDAVFARAGFSSSEVVRAVWETAARMQKVPDCVLASKDTKATHIEAIREGAGLARRMAQDLGLHIPHVLPDYRMLRDEAYDDLIDEMAAHHA